MAKQVTGNIRKALPKDEIIWVRQHALSGNEFIVTSAPDRLIYNGYQIVSEGYKFLGKNKSPLVLYEIFEEIDPTAAPHQEEAVQKKTKRRNQSTKVV